MRGCCAQASASAVRAVLAAVYHRLGRPLPLSFALCDGPVVLPLRALDWRRFEDFEQVPKCVSAYVIEYNPHQAGRGSAPSVLRGFGSEAHCQLASRAGLARDHQQVQQGALPPVGDAERERLPACLGRGEEPYVEARARDRVRAWGSGSGSQGKGQGQGFRVTRIGVYRGRELGLECLPAC